MRYCYNILLSNLRSIICWVVAYGRLKTEESFKLLALKVVAVDQTVKSYQGLK